MTINQPYLTTRNFIVSGVVEDGKLLGFTVCDKQNERYTDKLFETAGVAAEWGYKHYKGLCDECNQ